MHVAHKAVWDIESRLNEPLSLDSIATRLGVSAFHLARAFSVTHGMTLMTYVRRRRLTKAAQRLVGSDVRVIDVAFDAGYSSQQAFTRAFSAEFRVSPQLYRRQYQQTTLKGVEAIQMVPNLTIELQSPRIESLKAIRLIGSAQRYNAQSSAQIPDQWARFNQQQIARFEEKAAYGVCYNSDSEGNFDYLCGVKVDNFDGLFEDQDRLTVPAQTYAVFRHDGHISEIRNFWQAIWNQGLADANLTVSEGPEIERYGPEFDPETGDGGFEVWIPVK